MPELGDTLPNPQKLNPEQIARCDRDIATIHLMQKVTRNFLNAVPVVTAGYAVEAHCGGSITRSHGDIDMHIASLAIRDRTFFTRRVEDALRKESDHTNWTLYKSSDVSWAQEVEFREDAPKKAWPDRRRVELKLKTYPEETEDKFLIDSEGARINVKVMELHRLVTRKIKTLVESQGRTTGRLTTPQDLQDLKRLSALEHFNKDKVIELLTTMYQNEDKLEQTKARHKAFSEVIKLLP